MTGFSRRSFLSLTGGTLAVAATSPVLTACGGSSGASSVPDLTGKALLAAAKKEGTVTWYTNDDGMAAALEKGFLAQYPWAKFKRIIAPSGDVRNRVITETQAGTNTADVLCALPPANMAALRENNAIRAVKIAAESGLPKSYLDPSNYYHPFYQYAVVFAYNTKLVDKAPATVEEFAAPKYKGMIAFDRPQNALTSATFLVAPKHDWGQSKWEKWLEDVKANDILITASGSDALAKVQSGERAIGLCSSDNVIQLPKGTPVKSGFYPGLVPVVQCNFLTTKSASPNLGKLFVEWMATESGQKAIVASGRTAIMPGVASPGAFSKIVPAGIDVRPNSDFSDYFADPEKDLDKLYEMWPA